MGIRSLFYGSMGFCRFHLSHVLVLHVVGVVFQCHRNDTLACDCFEYGKPNYEIKLCFISDAYFLNKYMLNFIHHNFEYDKKRLVIITKNVGLPMKNYVSL